ncbi:MAG: alpha/beta fold hydrolase [Aureliella sp.]
MSGREFTSVRVQFAGGNGHQLGGIIDSPNDAPLSSGLFTHCFTCNKDLKAIVRISRGLAAQGLRTLRYDLTGLGNSEGDFSQTNFTTNRADLQAAADFLRAEYAPPSYLIGHSFGGACSLSMAEQIDSVKAVVSLASPSDTAHLADLLSKMNPEIPAAGVGTVTIGGRDYSIRKQMLDDFRQHDLPASLAAMSKPVLLLHSPVDQTLGFEHAMRLYGILTGSTASPPPPVSLINLPGADHLLVNDPDDLVFVTKVIAAWLERYAV